MQAKNPRILYQADWYVRETHLGIAEYARKVGWFLESQEHTQWPEAQFKGDGVIVFWGGRSQTRELLQQFSGPVVNISSKPNWDGYRVTIDNHRVGRVAAEYFLTKGFCNFCVLQCWGETYNWALRYRGEAFIDHLTQAGYDVAKIPYLEERAPEDCIKTIRPILAKCKGPLAVYACNDQSARDFIRRATSEGVTIPHDLAVLGSDDDELICEFCQIPISSIQISSFQQGYCAAEILDGLLQGRPPASKETFVTPGRIVERNSTETIAARDDQVRAILQYARKHIDQPLTVEQLAARVRIPVRTLQKRFSDELGCGINEAIIRLRIQRVCQLLETTSLSGKQIAHQLGFTNEYYLYRLFHKRMGMTMKQWRLSR